MTFEKKTQNEAENDWIMENDFREAGNTAGDLPDAEELDLSMMSKVSGGAAEGECRHDGGLMYQIRLRDISYKYNDGEKHYWRQRYYRCTRCGREFWEDELQR